MGGQERQCRVFAATLLGARGPAQRQRVRRAGQLGQAHSGAGRLHHTASGAWQYRGRVLPCGAEASQRLRLRGKQLEL